MPLLMLSGCCGRSNDVHEYQEIKTSFAYALEAFVAMECSMAEHNRLHAIYSRFDNKNDNNEVKAELAAYRTSALVLFEMYHKLFAMHVPQMSDDDYLLLFNHMKTKDFSDQLKVKGNPVVLLGAVSGEQVDNNIYKQALGDEYQYLSRGEFTSWINLLRNRKVE